MCMLVITYFKFLSDTIFLSGLERVVANHLTEQTDQNKLETKDDQKHADEEQWLVVNWLLDNEATNDHEDIYHVP